MTLRVPVMLALLGLSLTACQEVFEAPPKPDLYKAPYDFALAGRDATPPVSTPKDLSPPSTDLKPPKPDLSALHPDLGELPDLGDPPDLGVGDLSAGDLGLEDLGLPDALATSDAT